MTIVKVSNIVIIPLLTIVLFLASPLSFEPKAFGQNGQSGAMTGENMDLSVDPAQLPIDITENDRIMLSFTPKASELEGASITPGQIDHLDYRITILQDGNEVWTDQLHDHDGNLELEIIPTSEMQDVSVSGGEEDPGQTSTAPYVVEGPVLASNGQYTISAEIVGIEFNPIPEPITDEFSIQVVPEFPLAGAVTLAIAGLLMAVVFAGRKFSGNAGGISHRFGL